MQTYWPFVVVAGLVILILVWSALRANRVQRVTERRSKVLEQLTRIRLW